MDKHEIQSCVTSSLKIQAKELNSFASRVDDSVADAALLLSSCSGKIVVIGIGKSGLIGQKIAATMTSTGTPAVFIHAAEAIHGDLGGIAPNDVVLVLSNSGETMEICNLIPYLERLKTPIVAVTGRAESSLGKSANAVIDTAVELEADSMNLVPTSSTTVMLAAGDALACVLMEIRKFSKSDYSELHPGGSLGQKLMCRVRELMHAGDDMPFCPPTTTVRDAIFAITSKRLGCILVVDDANHLKGIVTDGDLRRAFQNEEHPLEHTVEDIMTEAPRSIGQDWLAMDALNFMEDNLITLLPVVDDKKVTIGVLHMHDLVRAGIK